MVFNALQKQDIDTLRDMLVELGNVLMSMQAYNPDLRLDVSQWPRVVIDVPEVFPSWLLTNMPPPAQYAEPIESAPEPDVVELWAPEPSPAPDAVEEIQASAPIAAPVKKTMPPLWSEAEDKTALEMFSGGSGYGDIAVKLGRALGGVKFRFDTKWKAIRDKRKPIVDLPKPAQQAAPVAAFAAPNPLLSGLTGVQSAISRRLDTLAYSNGHTAKTDLELVRHLGFGDRLQIIATDWGDDPRNLKRRFADLCGTELPSPDFKANLLVVLAARISEAA